MRFDSIRLAHIPATQPAQAFLASKVSSGSQPTLLLLLLLLLRSLTVLLAALLPQLLVACLCLVEGYFDLHDFWVSFRFLGCLSFLGFPGLLCLLGFLSFL